MISVFQICNASFATRDRLRSHLACHEDKIPCKVCGKFLRAAYMTDHLKKHSEGTHNYCGICNKGNCLKYLSMQYTVTSSSETTPSHAQTNIQSAVKSRTFRGLKLALIRFWYLVTGSAVYFKKNNTSSGVMVMLLK